MDAIQRGSEDLQPLTLLQLALQQILVALGPRELGVYLVLEPVFGVAGLHALDRRSEARA